MQTNPQDGALGREELTGIFLIGMLCLMVELIQVRMLSFFLGNISNFLAIPLALFGLALGSLFCHYIYKGDQRKLIATFSALVFPLLVLVFVLFFAIANTYFTEIHTAMQNPYRNSMRLLVFAVLFLPPYFVFGTLLTSYFSIGAEQIGRLYFFDLVGAAAGCFVTPMLFTYTDLPPVIVFLLFGALLLLVNTTVRRKVPLVVAAAAVFAVVQALAFEGALFREHPDPRVLSRTLFSAHARDGVEEVNVRWNDLARVALLRGGTLNPLADKSAFTIVQDDGVSNVKVNQYDPSKTPEQTLTESLAQSMPYVMGFVPKKILVVFAGVGHDMIQFDSFYRGKADITGVEINPGVVALASNPLMFQMNLRAFFHRKNVHMRVKEGRDFLNNDRGTYDLVFVATNGSVHANRTGHTRKYLDTYEAMRAYLDHLTRGGMVVFCTQPLDHKITSFKKLFAERGLTDFERAVYVFGRPDIPEFDNMIVKPQGITREEASKIRDRATAWDRHLKQLYSPYGPGNERSVSVVREPLDQAVAHLVTDDKPFTLKVDWGSFSLWPGKAKLIDKTYASSWIKVFTIFVFAVLSVIVVAVVRFLGGKSQRLPLAWLAYFFVTGISYMCVEIGLMAKTELFLGSPLYAVAVILAFFLAANGIGAWLQDRHAVMRGPRTLLVLTAVAILWGVLSVQICNSFLLSLPMALKILGVAICVLPAGTCLGMYYPLGVSTLVGGGLRGAVPATYALATLSSVLGSAWAMTAITNIGFSTIIIMGAVGYLLVAFIYLAARRYALG
jgi:spermidine synthase